MDDKTVRIEEIKGREGYCITINDKRIAGPKPWGGGYATRNWVANVDDVLNALNVDVAKVVRCCNCQKHDHDGATGYCNRWDKWTKMSDFCSCGERKDNEI